MHDQKCKLCNKVRSLSSLMGGMIHQGSTNIILYVEQSASHILVECCIVLINLESSLSLV